MDSWPKYRPKVSSAEFSEILELWHAWKDKKSTNMIKLGIRLDKVYESLTLPQKRRFMAVLIADDQLPEDIVMALDVFNGVLVKLTMEEKNEHN